MKTFLTVKLALVPLAVFWLLLGAQRPDWAIGSGFVLSLAGNLWRLYRGEFALLEVFGLALFMFLGQAMMLAPEWAADNALWLSFAGLGAVSLISVALGRPWTADYSRAAYSNNAGTMQFRLINAAITGLWGILFLATAICRWWGVSPWITTVIFMVGALASIFGPRLSIGFLLRRMRAGRETFHWLAPSFARPSDTDCDVVVIGAGIGGLTAAALLADAGRRVMVFDHHVAPGGFCHTFLRKAHHDNKPVLYRFDAGPHDFSGVWPGGTVSSLLERLGVADRLQWRRVCHSYCFAGERLDVPEDWHDYVELLCARFPASEAGIRALFDTLHAIFEDMYSTGRNRSGIPGLPETVEELLAFPKDHPAAFRWMNEPFDKLVAAHVSDPAVLELIYALSGYLGDGSERLTCGQMAPIFGYYFKGGHYPVGGSGRFADVLVEAIEERGGKVHLKTGAARILVENGCAAGVVLRDGRTIRARAVVSNADIKRTFLELVDPALLPADFRDRIAKAEPSNSAFSVHLGVDFDPDLAPAVHAGGVGIAIMSKLDATAAPKGHATLALISLVPYRRAKDWFPPEGGEDWKAWRRSSGYEDRKQKLGDEMIAKAEAAIPNLSQHIVYRTDASPVTYARYDWASSGAIYGISPQGRLKGSKSPLRNLVIAGGGNVGAGVEAVVISGAEAAEALAPGLLSSAWRCPAPAPDALCSRAAKPEMAT